jgi:hypothetical protein
MNATSSEQIELDPIRIDPRPCQLCGLTIDRHEMVDTGEGPIFYCPDLPLDEMTTDELERRGELIQQIEIAEILARMDAMDLVAAPEPVKPVAKQSYRTPQSTIDAFLHVARNESTEYLADWLARHPLDAPHLLKIWERKNAIA